MLKSFHTSVVTGLLCLVPTVALAQAPQFRLSEVRSQIVFDELSATDKRIIAEEAQLLLRGLYVHRFEKPSFYPGILDAVAAVEDVVNNIDALTTTEMELRLFEIFASQRDLHLNYIFPAPYAFWQNFLPFSLRRTISRDDQFEARISSVDTALFAQYAPNQRVPAVGDKILEYGGLPIDEAIEVEQRTAQGANKYGGFTRSIDRLTFKTQLLVPVPATDTVELTIQPLDRREAPYTIVVPWIVEYFGPPIPGLTQAEAASVTQAGGLLAPLPTVWTQEEMLKALSRGEDLYESLRQRFLNNHPALAMRSEYPNNPSAEPTVTWGIIENTSGRFGYLRIASFSSSLGTTLAIAEIRRLLLEELADTDGLIVDVRNNGGGSIGYADTLPQLFGRNEARTIEARLLNTNENLRIFNESIFGVVFQEFSASINDAAGTNNTYAAPVPFTTVEDANQLGQAYYGPVAVLTNGRSYSATDLFACSMRDNDQGLIFGQDHQTGAGGANVIEHSLFATFVPTVFRPLPAGHRMRVSWRQSVLFDEDRSIVEDFGCVADVDVPRVVDDILNGDETQKAYITKRLARLAQRRRYQASARTLESANRVELIGNTYQLAVRNTRTVELVLDDTVISIQVNASDEEQLVEFTLPPLAAGSTADATFRGFNRQGGKILWNVKKQFLILPSPTVVPTSGIEVDFASAPTLDPFVVINASAPENGWNLVPPFLQVGYNPTYSDDTNSDALAIFDLAELTRPELSFDLAYATEQFFDFVEVFVVDASGTQTFLLRQSGTASLQTYRFPLDEFAGQVVQVHFRFISDGAVTAPGAQLGRVQISNAQ